MTQQLSPRDWEYLSTYLDRQLKPKEIASLEARLSADPDFSAALGEMQRTRDALRSLPVMRAPRNFTLTPQMVGQRSKVRSRPAGRLAPVFGFASALATFILVLVIVGDLLGILTSATKPVAQAPARTSEAPLPPAATAQDLNQTAPSLGASSQPTMAAALEAEVQESPRALTDTTTLSLTVEAVAPSALVPGEPTVGPPTLSENMTTPITMTAKQATGMGGGEPLETGDNLLPPGSIATSEGPMWVSTVQFSVSLTETLRFPMTITLDGPPTAETYNPQLSDEVQAESLVQAEPTLTPVPEPPPAPTSTPEIVARIVETPTPSQPVPQSTRQAQVPSPTLSASPSSSQPARLNQSTVRILETTFALLALIAGLAAGYSWWSKRF